MTRPPSELRTLAGLRRGIDRLDRRLVVLLAERQRLVEAIAMVKADPGAVRDPARVSRVLANVLEAATTARLCPATARAVWRVLVECSTAHQVAWLRRNTIGSRAPRTRDPRPGGPLDI